jgi:dTDP-4-amino-4,6-dideoxygalactose transaminase
MNELQAAYGLIQLKTIDKQIDKRKLVAYKYRELLKDINGISFLEDFKEITHNYSYFPIFVENSYPLTRDELYYKLKENNIFGRRYFYPLISEFPPYRGLPSSNPAKLPIAIETANQVICLPIYPELEIENVRQIIELIKRR